MTRDDIISDVDEHFSGLTRPGKFTRGTCQCPECLEHEETMQSFTPGDLPLGKLDNPGWDPICFASDEAYAYFMPGLVRLVLAHTEDYVDQFLFHLSGRAFALSAHQRRALLRVLAFLALHEDAALENTLSLPDLNHAKEKLAQDLRADAP